MIDTKLNKSKINILIDQFVEKYLLNHISANKMTLIGLILGITSAILIVMNIEGEGARTLIGLVATGAVIIGIFRIVAAFQVKNMTFGEVAELRSSRAEFVDEIEGKAPESEE